MNVNYVGQILTTTSLIFETVKEDKQQCFYVNAGDGVVLSNNTLTFNDYIEGIQYNIDNTYTFTKISAKGDVIPSFVESAAYNDYVGSKRKQININNERFLKWFEELKKFYPFIDKDEDNIYNFKTQTNTKTLVSMKSFDVTSLYDYINNTDKAIEQIKSKCLSLMNDAAKEAFSKLNVEREKAILENDLDSVEEIDLIIQMINDEIQTTTFETLKKPEDVYTLWPPILLPCPV